LEGKGGGRKTSSSWGRRRVWGVWRVWRRRRGKWKSAGGGGEG